MNCEGQNVPPRFLCLPNDAQGAVGSIVFSFSLVCNMFICHLSMLFRLEMLE